MSWLPFGGDGSGGGDGGDGDSGGGGGSDVADLNLFGGNFGDSGGDSSDGSGSGGGGGEPTGPGGGVDLGTPGSGGLFGGVADALEGVAEATGEATQETGQELGGVSGDLRESNYGLGSGGGDATDDGGTSDIVSDIVSDIEPIDLPDPTPPEPPEPEEPPDTTEPPEPPDPTEPPQLPPEPDDRDVPETPPEPAVPGPVYGDATPNNRYVATIDVTVVGPDGRPAAGAPINISESGTPTPDPASGPAGPEGSASFRMSVGPPPKNTFTITSPVSSDEKTVRLNGGESASVTLTANEPQAPPSPGPLPSPPQSPPEPLGPPARFNITNLEVPTAVPYNGEYPVRATVQNIGEQTGTVVVGGPGGMSGRRELAGGEAATFSGTLTKQTVDPRQVKVTVRRQGNPVTRTLTRNVVAEVPSFALNSVNTPERVEVGDDYTIEAVIENTGDASGEFKASLGGTTERASLAPGETATVSLSGTADSTSPMNYPLSVQNTVTGDTVASRQITVDPVKPEFSLVEMNVPEETAAGEQVVTEFVIENTGDGEGEATVALPSAGFQRTVTIPPGESRTVDYSFQKSDIGVDQFDVKLTDEFAGSVVDRRIFNTGLAEPEFTIRSVDAPGQVAAGTRVPIEVTVANDGDAAGKVQLTAPGQTQTLDMDPDDTRTVNLSLVKSQTPFQTVRVSSRNLTTGVPSGFRNVSIQRADQPNDDGQQPTQPSPPRQPPRAAPGDGQGDDVPAFVAEFFDFLDTLDPFDGQQ